MVRDRIYIVNNCELKVRLVDAHTPFITRQLYKLLIEYNGIRVIDTDLITAEFFSDSECILTVIKLKFNWLFK